MGLRTLLITLAVFIVVAGTAWWALRPPASPADPVSPGLLERVRPESMAWLSVRWPDGAQARLERVAGLEVWVLRLTHHDRERVLPVPAERARAAANLIQSAWVRGEIIDLGRAPQTSVPLGAIEAGETELQLAFSADPAAGSEAQEQVESLRVALLTLGGGVRMTRAHVGSDPDVKRIDATVARMLEQPSIVAWSQLTLLQEGVGEPRSLTVRREAEHVRLERVGAGWRMHLADSPEHSTSVPAMRAAVDAVVSSLAPIPVTSPRVDVDDPAFAFSTEPSIELTSRVLRAPGETLEIVQRVFVGAVAEATTGERFVRVEARTGSGAALWGPIVGTIDGEFAARLPVQPTDFADRRVFADPAADVRIVEILRPTTGTLQVGDDAAFAEAMRFVRTLDGWTREGAGPLPPTDEEALLDLLTLLCTREARVVSLAGSIGSHEAASAPLAVVRLSRARGEPLGIATISVDRGEILVSSGPFIRVFQGAPRAERLLRAATGR